MARHLVDRVRDSLRLAGNKRKKKFDHETNWKKNVQFFSLAANKSEISEQNHA